MKIPERVEWTIVGAGFGVAFGLITAAIIVALFAPGGILTR